MGFSLLDPFNQGLHEVLNYQSKQFESSYFVFCKSKTVGNCEYIDCSFWAAKPHFWGHDAFHFLVSLSSVEVPCNCSYSAYDEKRPKHTFCPNSSPDSHSWNIKHFICHSVWGFITPVNTFISINSSICLECCVLCP